MTLTFISNYINHHQIPFCDACREKLGEGFHFVQTMPMEAERLSMGWDASQIPPYVVLAYEEPARAETLVREADIALVGWAEREDLVAARMAAGRPTVRISERIYREGEWRRFSPRGLYHKYQEHLRYRRSPLWLLAIGAYTASDFRLIGAYPDKIYRWGYFPPFEACGEAELLRHKAGNTGTEGLSLLWAGRFIPLKHPDHALRAARALAEAGRSFTLTMVGDGEERPALEGLREQWGLRERVRFTGFLTPEETREQMLRSHLFLFTSDHREGWGAVVSEAMGAGCAVVAGSEAGAPAALIRSGENGVLYHGTDPNALCREVLKLTADPALARRLGLAGYRTVAETWNAARASEELLRFCRSVLSGERFLPPAEGPMSVDPAVRPYL